VKTICGSFEPQPYSLRSFTYCTKQARSDEVQRVIMCNIKSDDSPLILKHVECVNKILFYCKYVVVLGSVGSELISIKHSGMTFVKKAKKECVLR